MKTFSVTAAAFSGFRLIKQRPVSVTVWGILYFAVIGVAAALIFKEAGSYFAQIQALQSSQPPQPEQVFVLVRHLIPFYLELVLIELLLYSVAAAAVNRAIQKPKASRFAYLRLGPDELRQFGLTLFTFVVLFGIETAFVITGLLFVAILTGLMFLVKAPTAVIFIVHTAAMLAIWLGCIFVVVRLSLAVPLTFASKRIDLFGSWAITRGQFWPILGTYVLAGFMMLVVVLPLFIVLMGVSGQFAMLLHPSGNAAFIHNNFSGFSSVATPTQIASGLLSVLVSIFMLVMIYAPAATIYRELTTANSSGEKLTLETGD